MSLNAKRERWDKGNKGVICIALKTFGCARVVYGSVEGMTQ